MLTLCAAHIVTHRRTCTGSCSRDGLYNYVALSLKGRLSFEYFTARRQIVCRRGDRLIIANCYRRLITIGFNRSLSHAAGENKSSRRIDDRSCVTRLGWNYCQLISTFLLLAHYSRYRLPDLCIHACVLRLCKRAISVEKILSKALSARGNCRANNNVHRDTLCEKKISKR